MKHKLTYFVFSVAQRCSNTHFKIIFFFVREAASQVYKEVTVIRTNEPGTQSNKNDAIQNILNLLATSPCLSVLHLFFMFAGRSYFDRKDGRSCQSRNNHGN